MSGSPNVVKDEGICENDNTQSSVGSFEDEWDLGSEDSIGLQLTPYGGDKTANRRSGELILSGDEDSSYGRNGHEDVALETMFRTAADLSLPGTESLATDIDSLVDDIISYVSTTSMRSRPLSTGTLASAGTEAHAQDVATDRAPMRSWRLSKVHLLLILIATTTVTTMLSAYLAWDRNSWRTTALELEKELERLQLDMKKKQSEVSRTRKKLLGNLKLGNSTDFDWSDDCQASAPKKVVLADNCWLHAEAALSLGECGKNIQESAKSFLGTLGSIGSSLFGELALVATKEFEHHPDDFVNANVGRPQTAGITLDDVVDTTSSIAEATVAASDAVVAAFSGVGGLFDDYMSMVLNATRDAIEDGSFQSFLD